MEVGLAYFVRFILMCHVLLLPVSSCVPSLVIVLISITCDRLASVYLVHVFFLFLSVCCCLHFVCSSCFICCPVCGWLGLVFERFVFLNFSLLPVFAVYTRGIGKASYFEAWGHWPEYKNDDNKHISPGPLEVLRLWKYHKYPKHVVSFCSENVVSGGPSCVLCTHGELLFSTWTYELTHNGQEDGIGFTIKRRGKTISLGIHTSRTEFELNPRDRNSFYLSSKWAKHNWQTIRQTPTWPVRTIDPLSQQWSGISNPRFQTRRPTFLRN